MLVGRVLDEVGDALVLEQAADEGEVALAVLHAVDPRHVGLAQPQLELRPRVGARHLLDDVGDALVLEDAAVVAAREEPEPGDHDGLVAREALLAVRGGGAAQVGEMADVAVPVALRLAVELEVEAHRLAEDLRVGDVVPLAQELEPELERLADRLAAVEAAEQQHAVAEAARQGDSVRQAPRPRAARSRSIQFARPRL